MEKLLRDKELKFYSFNYLFICNFWRVNGQIPHKTVCLSWRNFRTSHTWSRFANHFTSTLTIKPVYPKTGKQMKNESQVTTLTYASAVICHCCPYGSLGLKFCSVQATKHAFKEQKVSTDPLLYRANSPAGGESRFSLQDVGNLSWVTTAGAVSRPYK